MSSHNPFQQNTRKSFLYQDETAQPQLKLAHSQNDPQRGPAQNQQVDVSPSSTKNLADGSSKPIQVLCRGKSNNTCYPVTKTMKKSASHSYTSPDFQKKSKMASDECSPLTQTPRERTSLGCLPVTQAKSKAIIEASKVVEACVSGTDGSCDHLASDESIGDELNFVGEQYAEFLEVETRAMQHEIGPLENQSKQQIKILKGGIVDSEKLIDKKDMLLTKGEIGEALEQAQIVQEALATLARFEQAVLDPLEKSKVDMACSEMLHATGTRELEKDISNLKEKLKVKVAAEKAVVQALEAPAKLTREYLTKESQLTPSLNAAALAGQAAAEDGAAIIKKQQGVISDLECELKSAHRRISELEHPVASLKDEATEQIKKIATAADQSARADTDQVASKQQLSALKARTEDAEKKLALAAAVAAANLQAREDAHAAELKERDELISQLEQKSLSESRKYKEAYENWRAASKESQEAADQMIQALEKRLKDSKDNAAKAALEDQTQISQVLHAGQTFPVKTPGQQAAEVEDDEKTVENQAGKSGKTQVTPSTTIRGAFLRRLAADCRSEPKSSNSVSSALFPSFAINQASRLFTRFAQL
eukprot:gnl/MRDRNA2_/MRDRNA2_85591_c0_seq2.p1 gnl/MRDRNA2_/MRDRNA2_85591_c0~~gnl/MRDRNA2_/MRDRNA2_85591_c0_seq2.p1  ORF type:complete len:595 (+),score=169.19 gnl/MRDRNA2_/MRDRNA2_85591_c0_seq2:349-2133(+)